MDREENLATSQSEIRRKVQGRKARILLYGPLGLTYREYVIVVTLQWNVKRHTSFQFATHLWQLTDHNYGQ